MNVKILIMTVIASVFLGGCNIGGDSQEVTIDQLVQSASHPYISSMQPTTQEKGVGSVPNIVITFVKPLSGANLQSSIVLRDASDISVPTTNVLSADKLHVTLDLGSETLKYGNDYAVKIDSNLQFEDGSRMDFSYKSIFTTAKVAKVNTLIGTKLDMDAITNVAISGDGIAAVATSYIIQGKVVKLNKLVDSWEAPYFTTIPDGLTAFGDQVEISRDGRMFVVSEQGAAVHQLRIFKDNAIVSQGLEFISMSLSSDGSRLVLNSNILGSHFLYTYNGSYYTQLYSLPYDTTTISAISPDGLIGVSVTSLPALSISRLSTVPTANGYINTGYVPTSLAFNEDGSLLLVTRNEDIKMYQDVNHDGNYVLKDVAALPVIDAQTRIGKLSTDGTTVWVSVPGFYNGGFAVGKLLKYRFDIGSGKFIMHSTFTYPNALASNLFSAKFDISDDGQKAIVAAIPAAGTKEVFIFE